MSTKKITQKVKITDKPSDLDSFTLGYELNKTYRDVRLEFQARADKA